MLASYFSYEYYLPFELAVHIFVHQTNLIDASGNLLLTKRVQTSETNKLREGRRAWAGEQDEDMHDAGRDKSAAAAAGEKALLLPLPPPPPPPPPPSHPG